MHPSENRFYREKTPNASLRQFKRDLAIGLLLALGVAVGLWLTDEPLPEAAPVEPPIQYETPVLQACLDKQARLLGLHRDSDAVFNVCVDILGDM